MSTSEINQTAIYSVEGMTCEGCVSSLTRALKAGSATEVNVDLATHTARVAGLSEEAVRAIIEGAGFDVTAVER